MYVDVIELERHFLSISMVDVFNSFNNEQEIICYIRILYLYKYSYNKNNMD